MATSETLLKKTQRGLSILAFETTKQSRILKKRMRVAALQKEIKADLRDLGNLVYNAVLNEQTGILGEEEVKILVQNIRHNKAEVERLRDSIGRLNRAKKHFTEVELDEEEVAAPRPDEPALVVVESTTAPPLRDVEVSTERELKEAMIDPGQPFDSGEVQSAKKKRKSEVSADQGADLEADPS
ncbi:MAG: hypothetical protein HZB55_22975 [Deltaproteobacteria bacterium]|nr:hypothetical protein [Deltaproteobacteria bacterium]